MREKAARFYLDVLGCRKLGNEPYPDLDLYEFDGGFVLGLFFFDEADTFIRERTPQGNLGWRLKPTTPKPSSKGSFSFGVREVEFNDPSRFYFQAPGRAGVSCGLRWMAGFSISWLHSAGHAQAPNIIEGASFPVYTRITGTETYE